MKRSSRPTTRRANTFPTKRIFALAALLLAGAALWLAGGAAHAQNATNSPNPNAPIMLAQAGGPAWNELSPQQQNALRPLAGEWNNLSPQQKRKWLRTSEKLDNTDPNTQAKAQERMGQWSSLSPQQRAQARLNFAETRQLTDGLTPEQRQAQWQAYQLLSPEEKRQLAANARGLPPGAAIAVRPAQAPVNVQPAPEFGSANALSRLQGQPPAPVRRILPLKPGQQAQQN
jgi:Protein of unknown function (DUF3106)